MIKFIISYQLKHLGQLVIYQMPNGFINFMFGCWTFLEADILGKLRLSGLWFGVKTTQKFGWAKAWLGYGLFME